MKKHIIWSNDTDQFTDDEIREEISECRDIPKEEITDKMVSDEKYRLTEIYYEDEKLNLNKTLNGRILCIASLGLWDGRKCGYRIMGDNLSEVLNAFQGDYCEVYSDGRNIVAKDTHHDGTNYYTFREIKEDKNIDNLLNKLDDGNATSSDISRYTKSLAPYVANIYGWGKTSKAPAQMAA